MTRIHMVGIGGAGMSALARLYLQRGETLSGSDQVASRALDELRALGADCYAGSDPPRAAAADLVVYSSAVPETDPELSAARAAGVRSVKHAVALGDLFNTRRGIAIAGTHGKTTTSSMVSLILERAGLRPSFQVGGEIMDLGTSARWGAGEWFVVEADEFDRRFLEYTPEVATINNVEPDHFEYYATYENMRGAFADFLRRLRPDGTAVVWGEDERLSGIVKEVQPPHVVTFGLDTNGTSWDVSASDVALEGGGSHFSARAGDEAADVRLVIPGVHNVRNALAAIATSRSAGVSLTHAAQTLAQFHGARRRLQLLAEHAGIRVFDDYAHHPTAVQLMIEAMRRQVPRDGRLWAVFQPHLRTRTEELFDELAGAFAGADVALITDVYSPKGREPEGAYRDSAALVRATRHPGARHVPTLEEARAILARDLRPGDIALIMGAGTIERLAQEVASDVKQRA
ncbi:MAG TPA: UDP-N-acetylmuramate--L-alanine ligase [Chloroflexota bacterium]|nr:UDP-N-acetylmuramate--L-alanine ligase [Chloroflexota bacterium]